MNIEELREWLTGRLNDAESDLEKIKEANHRGAWPDLISRRVVETETMIYRNILHQIAESE